MRFFALFIILSLVPIGIYSSSLYIGLDAISLLDNLSVPKGLRLEAGFKVAEDLRLSFSPSFYVIKEESFELNSFDVNLSIDYYPFVPIPFYTGVSAFKIAYLTGYDRPDNNILHLGEIRIGYEVSVKKLIMDFRFTYLEDSFSKEDNLSLLSERICQFKKYNFTVLLSLKI